MRKMAVLLAVLLAVGLMVAGCGVHAGVNGNDTAGIIPWSPEAEIQAADLVAAHCARYNKVAIITAAGSGIGAACASELAAQGYKVAVMSASGKGEALGKALGGLGFTGSNTDPAVLERVVETTLERWGRIDAVVNSAGHPPKGKLLEIVRRRRGHARDEPIGALRRGKGAQESFD